MLPRPRSTTLTLTRAAHAPRGSRRDERHRPTPRHLSRRGPARPLRDSLPVRRERRARGDALLADPPLAAPSAPSGLTTGAATMAAAGHPRAQPHDYVFGAPPAAESNIVANIIGHGPGRRPEPAVGTPVGVGVPVSVPLVPVGFGSEPSPPECEPAQQAPSDHAVPDRATRPPPDLGPTPALTVGLPPPRLTGRRKALLVGINYRGTRAELRGCHNDVASLFDLLTQKYGWDRTCVHALVDDGRRGFAGEPTRANVNGLRWLSQDARPGDVLFFAFSGHGAQQPDPNGFEEDGMNETILPVDFQTAGMITDDEIGSILVRALPDGVRLTALMDSCHSGTGLDLPYSWEPRFGGWREETNPYHSLGDVQMISGCEDDDVSCDARHYGRARRDDHRVLRRPAQVSRPELPRVTPRDVAAHRREGHVAAPAALELAEDTVRSTVSRGRHLQQRESHNRTSVSTKVSAETEGRLVDAPRDVAGRRGGGVRGYARWRRAGVRDGGGVERDRGYVRLGRGAPGRSIRRVSGTHSRVSRRTHGGLANHTNDRRAACTNYRMYL